MEKKEGAYSVEQDNKDDNVDDEEDNGLRKDGQRSAG